MSIKYTILGLLHYRDLHGYRIKEVIEQNFGHMWTINYGQIYPNLKKMLEEELITVRELVQEGEKGPPRKMYSITENGRNEFNQWLLSSPEGNTLLRDPFLMRFVFFGFGDKKRAVEIIDDQMKVYKEQLKKREANLKLWERNDIYVNLMAEFGVKMNKMLLEWLEESRQKILESE
ncbi:PadR family transcriptional regulator [bacterium]|nr:PadR family transcriptional regulator [bacterium]